MEALERERWTAVSTENRDALVGVLLEDPVLECLRDGGHRFVVRIVSQLPAQVEGDAAGSGLEVCTLVAGGVMAERAFEQFTAGDYCVAVGTLRPGRCGDGPHCLAGRVFEAEAIGHDLVRSRYAVDRTRRGQRFAAAGSAGRRAAIVRELEIAAAPVPAWSARQR